MATTKGAWANFTTTCNICGVWRHDGRECGQPPRMASATPPRHIMGRMRTRAMQRHHSHFPQMLGHQMSEQLHYVKVTPGSLDDDDMWRDAATLKFECRGDKTSKCHQYPACDCESWSDDHEHPYVSHDECWMQGWFESECGASYKGADFDDMDDRGIPRSMDREGFIEVSFEWEYIEWVWAS